MHTFYKKCSEKPRRIGRRNASHTFYKKCAGVDLGCGGVDVNTFYKKCARGGCTVWMWDEVWTMGGDLCMNKSALARKMNVSRAYVSKVLRGEEVNFTFASVRALERRYRDRLRRPTLRSKASSAHLRFAHALQMDFIPQMAVPSFDESPSNSNSNLSTPAFALA